MGPGRREWGSGSEVIMKKPVLKNIGCIGILCAIFTALYALPYTLSPAVHAAGFDGGSAGTSGAQFLKVASGARGAAMAEAYSAIADDAFALDWNPAGILTVKKHSIVFMHAPYLAGTFVDYFGYVENAGEVGAWGVALKYMNFGSIHKTDSNGFDLGGFTPYDISASVSFATYISSYKRKPEERTILGATGKFVRSKLESSDSTLSADIGLMFPWLFDKRFRLAMSAQNIMGALRYDKEEAPLPLIFRVGSVTKLTKRFLMTIDVVAPKDNLSYIAAGGEMKIPLSKTLNSALRAGFNTRAISEVGGFHNITIGFGLQHGTYHLDYALSPFGNLGLAHRISVGWDWSTQKKLRKIYGKYK
ncbi:MAG TPA: hypothetical protein DCL44_06730 [Elusimicrobia bacterium]|nr:hypothetical protein [Elusimicrobiota bacterium]